MLIRNLLTEAARNFGDTIAVDDENRTLNWSELDELARSLAANLAAASIEAGDRVAVVSKNRWEVVALYFACAELGAVLVPLNWRLLAGELHALVADCEAVALFASREYASAFTSATPRLRFCFETECEDVWEPFANLVSKSATEPREAGEHDIAIQMYTSGTTGFPKGAMLTNRNVCSLAALWAREIDLRGGADRFLQVTPLFHVGGMLMLMSVASVGATLVLHPEFQPDLALQALRDERITHSLFVPAMLQWLLLQPEAEDAEYPELRLLAYGAAPAGPELLRRASTVFGCAFLQGYGLTETAGVLTILRPADHQHADKSVETARLASIGRGIETCEVRVVDDKGVPVEAGAIGEIVARGENVFPGYWKVAERTEESWRADWFRTGDLARIDADGFITIVDRMKDMILVGGENVYPSEVERVLLAHQAVDDAAVIGIPHEVWGEEVLAHVQLAHRASETARELIQHCRKFLARFKCPTKVAFLDAIPRNAAGKCEKSALREPYWKGSDRKV